MSRSWDQCDDEIGRQREKVKRRSNVTKLLMSSSLFWTSPPPSRLGYARRICDSNVTDEQPKNIYLSAVFHFLHANAEVCCDRSDTPTWHGHGDYLFFFYFLLIFISK